jgi:hypothetical protein
MPDPKVTPKTEAEWEEEILDEVLKDALKSDGTIDFDKLRATGTTITLDELYPEDAEDDEA